MYFHFDSDYDIVCTVLQRLDITGAGSVVLLLLNCVVVVFVEVFQ